MLTLHPSTGGGANRRISGPKARSQKRNSTFVYKSTPRSSKDSRNSNSLVSGIVNTDLQTLYLLIMKVNISDLQKWFTRGSQVLEKPQVIGKCFCCRHKLKQTAHFLQELPTAVAVSLKVVRRGEVFLSLPPHFLPLSEVRFFLTLRSSDWGKEAIDKEFQEWDPPSKAIALS